MKIKKGFTLIELGVSMGIMGSLALVNVQEDQFESSQVKARAMGTEIFHHNGAVSRYLAAHAADPSVIGVSASIDQSHTGVDWLKGSGCGGSADDDYLSCDVMMEGRTIQYQSQPSTTLSMTSKGALVARTVWTPAIGEDGKEDSMVMGIAAMVASGSYISQAEDGASGYQMPTVYCPDMSSYSPSISSICGTDRHHIVSMANTSSAIEPWLRTDHGNTMRHIIEFGDDISSQSDINAVDDGSAIGAWVGSGMRQIVNVARLYNGGSTGDDSVVIGSQYGKTLFTDGFVTSNSLLKNATILDGDAAVMEDLRVKVNAFIDNNIEAGNDIAAGNDITAGNDVTASRNVNAGSDVLAGGYVRAGIDVIADRDARAQRDMYAKRYYDNDNNGFYVDPASTSRMNTVDADLLKSRGEVHGTLFRDINNGSYYVDPTSRSIVNSMTATGDMRATRFYDQNNTGYYIDPDSTSRLNSIDANFILSRGEVRGTLFRDGNSGYLVNPASTSQLNALNANSITANGRLRVNDYLHLNKTASENGGCSPNGLLAKKSNGSILNCVSGKWTALGGGGLINKKMCDQLGDGHQWNPTIWGGTCKHPAPFMGGY